MGESYNLTDKPITASITAPLRGSKRWSYLQKAKVIRFASIDEDGQIYLSPLWFIVEDERIYVPIDAASRHSTNFDSGRPLAALVDGGDEFAMVSGVRIIGTMNKLDEPELLARLRPLLLTKYFHVGHPHADNYFEFGDFADRQVYELVPSKMIGWDQREATTLQSPESRTLPSVAIDRKLP